MFYLIIIFVSNALSIVFYLFGVIFKYTGQFLLKLSSVILTKENWMVVEKLKRKVPRIKKNFKH